jgi:phosphoribosylglycinamide formyltransferase-1
MEKKNIAVLVSGGGTNLQALIDAEKDGRLKSGRIKLVLSSSPDAYALTRARNNGIETCVAAKKEYPDRSDYSRALLKELDSRNIDLIILAGFMYILDSDFIDHYRNAIINIHPALIPSFCGDGFYGLRVHEAALSYGVKLTGATAHFVTEVTDGGPIILQKAVEIKEGDTPEILQRRVMEQAEWQILPLAAELFCAGKLSVEGRTVKISE